MITWYAQDLSSKYFSLTLFLSLKENHMLYTIAVVFIILWLLGVVTSYTMNGFIHVLLVIAVITVLLRLIRGENILKGKN